MWNLQHNFLGGRRAFLEANIETEVSECQDSTNVPNRPDFQGVKEVLLHSTPKTLQITLPLGITVSPKSFIKSKIFPEAASFKVFDNEPALPTCCTKRCGKSQLRNKNYFSTKRGIPFSSSSLTKHSTTSFPDRGASSQRNVCAATVTEWCFASKGALRCAVVARACEIHFPYS